MKRILCFAIIFSIALSLVGCSNAHRPGQETSSAAGQGDEGLPPSSMYSSENMERPKEYNLTGRSMILTAEALTLPDKEVSMIDLAAAGGKVFMRGVDRERAFHFYTFDSRDRKPVEISGIEGKGVESLSFSPDGSFHTLGNDEQGQYQIVSVGPDGSISRVTPQLEDRQGMAFGFAASRDAFFMEIDGHMLAIDKTGQILQDYGTVQGTQKVVALENKTLLVRMDSAQLQLAPGQETGGLVIELNDDLTMGQSYAVKNRFASFLPGYGDHLLGYMENVIYDYDYKTGESRALVNTLSTNVEINSFACLEEDLFVGLRQGACYLFSPAKPGSVQTITLAGYGLSYDIEDAVASFNMNNGSYVIELIDYAKYDTYDTAGVGATRLANDIITGNVPDIFSLNTFAPNILATKGLLEDIRPWFQADGEKGLDSLWPCVIRATEFREGIYEFVPAFSVKTMVAAPDMDVENWNIQRFIETVESYSAETILGSGMTRNAFLRQVMSFGRGTLYSPEEKSCDFDSPEFIALLKLATDLPQDSAPDTDFFQSLTGGQQKMDLGDFSNFGSLANITDSILLLGECFGGAPQYIGFPAKKGGISGIEPIERLGMSAASENKEGVWQFFRFLLSYDGWSAMRTRAISSSMETAEIDISAQLDTAEKDPYGHDFGNINIKPEPLSREILQPQIDRILSEASIMAVCDGQLEEIVLSCAQNMFQGGKSPEDTAKEIQSRASIYLAEQYG